MSGVTRGKDKRVSMKMISSKIKEQKAVITTLSTGLVKAIDSIQVKEVGRLTEQRGLASGKTGAEQCHQSQLSNLHKWRANR